MFSAPHGGALKKVISKVLNFIGIGGGLVVFGVTGAVWLYFDFSPNQPPLTGREVMGLFVIALFVVCGLKWGWEKINGEAPSSNLEE